MLGGMGSVQKVSIVFLKNSNEEREMKKIFSVAICMAVFGWAGNASAVTTVAYETSSPIFYTSGLTGFSTLGSEMTGMTFTFTLAGGTVKTSTWGSLGSGTYGVVVANGNDSLRIAMSGDSFTTLWDSDDIVNGNNGISIDKFVIDAGAGNAVFDVLSNSVGTAGSADGRPFSTTNSTGGGFDILATYSGRVALTGNAPVGDLYRYLTVDFINGQFGPDYDVIDFYADTDSLKLKGDLNPIPEPTTMLLFGAGILGLAGVARKKRS